MGSLLKCIVKSEIREQVSFEYGVAKFTLSNTMNQKYRESIRKVDENNFGMLQNIQWALDYKEFINFPWNDVFQCLISTQVLTLSCHQCGTQKILRCISHVSFKNLITLTLDKNKIQNIEDLAWLDTPQLHQLKINNNHITKIQPLAKCNFRHLIKLYLKENDLSQLNKMSRVKFLPDGAQVTNQKPTHSILSIEHSDTFNTIQIEREQDEDIAYVFRLERVKFESVSINQNDMRRKHYNKFHKDRFCV